MFRSDKNMKYKLISLNVLEGQFVLGAGGVWGEGAWAEYQSRTAINAGQRELTMLLILTSDLKVILRKSLTACLKADGQRRHKQFPNGLWYDKWAGLMRTSRKCTCWNISLFSLFLIFLLLSIWPTVNELATPFKMRKRQCKSNTPVFYCRFPWCHSFLCSSFIVDDWGSSRGHGRRDGSEQEAQHSSARCCRLQF